MTPNAASRERPTVTIFRTFAEEALLHRVRGEFKEMPGLRLTIDQAMRLWTLDRRTCDSVLDSLVASHFLERDLEGRYHRCHSGY